MVEMFALRRDGSRVQIRRVPRPEPTESQVRIRVALAGVCRTDILAARGLIPCADGITLGHEFAGTIDALGPGVSGWNLGQRVAVCPVFGCRNCDVCADDEINCPNRTMLGLDHDGAFAEYVCVRAACLYPIPESISWAAAAYAEPIAAALGVLDASVTRGGCGLVLGRNRFADLVLRLLRLYGIDDVHRSGEAGSFDFVIETGLGAGTLSEMIRAARPGGILVLKSRQPGEVGLDVLALGRKRLTILGANYGSFREAVSLLVEGRLEVGDLCGPVYPLSAFESAFAKDTEGESAKVFLDPWGDHVRNPR